MAKKTRRFFLREKEIKNLLLALSEKFNLDFEQLVGVKPRVEMRRKESTETFFFNGKPLMVRLNGDFFPALLFHEFLTFIPKVVIDMGAIPYVCRGADIMAPGVVRINGAFKKNDILLVVDERHEKPLAVGVALFNSQTMDKTKHGKVIRSLHHVGDKLWDSYAP